jgi:hypothetical protein
MFRASLVSSLFFLVFNVASAQDPATAPAFGYKDSYQINVTGNVLFADSIVNITNAGNHPGGHGYICANVYVFDPDEQMISCCTCPVSRNGVKSLSAQGDLVWNTLTGIVPSSITIKLVATVPPGGPIAPQTCDPTVLPASNVFPPLPTSPGPLGTNGGFAAGMRAWATHIHSVSSLSGPIQFGTETEFSQVPLNRMELVTLAQFCSLIGGNGSSAGVCRTCQPGAR